MAIHLVIHLHVDIVILHIGHEHVVDYVQLAENTFLLQYRKILIKLA